MLSSKEKKALILLDQLLNKLNLEDLKEHLLALTGIDSKLDRFVAVVLRLIRLKKACIVAGISLTDLMSENKFYAVFGIEKELLKGFSVGAGVKFNMHDWKDVRFWVGFLWQL